MVYHPEQVKFAAITSAGAATAIVVAAVAGKSIFVLGYELVSASAATFQWKSATTAISGVESLAANGVIARDNPYGVMKTVAGEALNLTIAGSSVVGGVLTYIER